MTGFRKMRRLGIPQVPMRIEDAVRQMVAEQFLAMFAGLVTFITEEARGGGLSVSLGVVSDAAPWDIYQALIDLMGERGSDVEKMRHNLNVQLVNAESDLFKGLSTDAPELAAILMSFSLPKQEVFNARIEGLRRLYLDGAVERIRGESDRLKRQFLRKLVDWAEGKTSTLNVSSIVQEMQESSDSTARYFARDQFSRFNKALTVETYEQAEASYVEVINVGDARVRETHQNYHGHEVDGVVPWGRRIFRIDALRNQPQYGDYNCRCGFVPHWTLTAEEKRRVVA